MDSTRTEIAGLDLRGFITNSMVEWEGRICAVVFTATCNWRCPYCHGWRFVKDSENLQPIDPDKVFDLVENQRGWVDGVAISGGEPTLQPGLYDFIKELKSRGAAVKLETNGTHPEVIEKLLDDNLLDCLAMDYKNPLDERLQTVTCVSESITNAEAVKRSYGLAQASGIEREYHTTLCPQFINAELITEMGAELEEGGLWVLQQYEPDDVLDIEASGKERFSESELDAIENAAKKTHQRVLMRRGKGI